MHNCQTRICYIKIKSTFCAAAGSEYCHLFQIQVQLQSVLNLFIISTRSILPYTVYCTSPSAFKNFFDLCFFFLCVNFSFLASAYTNTACPNVSSVYSSKLLRRLCLCCMRVSMLIPVCECLCDVCDVYLCVCVCQWWVESAWLVSCVGGQADSTLLST